MKWREAALLHAKEEDPKESVGLVVLIKGKEHYKRCGNIADEPTTTFLLDPDDYAKWSDKGTIMSIVHSHPVTYPTPSKADLISCEASKLPWHIVNPNTETWGECKPNGYKAPLLGRPWCWGVSDCWTLVRDWYKEELKIILKDWERPRTPTDFLRNPLFESLSGEAGFRELRPEEGFEKGDVLLMSMMHPGLNHVGVYIPQQKVLHHCTGRLSTEDLLDEWLLKCTGKRYRYAPQS